MDAFIDAVSGAIGSVVSSMIFYPIDNFRTRVQALGVNKGEQEDKKLSETQSLYELWQRMVQDEGLSSFYKGISVALVANAVAYGCYFWWYRFFKTQFASPEGDPFSSI